MPLGPYFVDIACIAEKLIIELDGGQHASAGKYDAARTRFLEARGFRVLRFWNNDALENLDGVLERIAEVISTSPSQPSAGSLPLPMGEGL
jgi:very-short-patch-repair endonuclease